MVQAVNYYYVRFQTKILWLNCDSLAHAPQAGVKSELFFFDLFSFSIPFLFRSLYVIGAF